MCLHLCPGLHQKQCDNQADGGGSVPLAHSQDLESCIWLWGSSMQVSVRMGPEECHTKTHQEVANTSPTKKG